MRHQYEEKLNVLMNRIRATQEERDKVRETEVVVEGRQEVGKMKKEINKKLTPV